MLAIGRPALRIISVSFLLAGVSIICSSSCQAFGFGMYSLYISVARQLVVLVPAAYLLSLSGVLESVWWSFPIAELISLTGGLLMLRPRPEENRHGDTEKISETAPAQLRGADYFMPAPRP